MPYIVITRENIKEIAKRFDRHEGRLFIAEPGNGFWGQISDGGHWSLYDMPILGEDGNFCTERGSKIMHGESWQTNWENDRDYVLKKRPEPSQDPATNLCRSLFDQHSLRGYEFKIGFQAVTGRSLGELNLYIPRQDSPEPAFVYGLTHVIQRISEYEKKEILSKQDIEHLAKQMAADLSTGEEFMNNVRAGISADTFLGL